MSLDLGFWFFFDASEEYWSCSGEAWRTGREYYVQPCFQSDRKSAASISFKGKRQCFFSQKSGSSVLCTSAPLLKDRINYICFLLEKHLLIFGWKVLWKCQVVWLIDLFISNLHKINGTNGRNCTKEAQKPVQSPWYLVMRTILQGCLLSQVCLEWLSDLHMYSHRTVWVGSDLKDHLVPIPCHGQRHPPLDQVAQSPIQPTLERSQGWGVHNFSGQHAPVPHHPHSEEYLPYI